MKERFEARQANSYFGLWGVWDNLYNEWIWDNFAETEWKSLNKKAAELKAWEINMRIKTR